MWRSTSQTLKSKSERLQGIMDMRCLRTVDAHGNTFSNDPWGPTTALMSEIAGMRC